MSCIERESRHARSQPKAAGLQEQLDPDERPAESMDSVLGYARTHEPGWTSRVRARRDGLARAAALPAARDRARARPRERAR